MIKTIMIVSKSSCESFDKYASTPETTAAATLSSLEYMLIKAQTIVKSLIISKMEMTLPRSGSKPSDLTNWV